MIIKGDTSRGVCYVVKRSEDQRRPPAGCVGSLILWTFDEGPSATPTLRFVVTKLLSGED